MAASSEGSDRTRLPPGTVIVSPFGEERVGTVAELLAVLDGMQRTADDDTFVTVSRPDGTFVQMRRLTLECGDGTGPVLQGTLPPGMRAFFVDFALGRDGWDDGVEWSEPSKGRGLGRILPWWLPVLVVGLLCAGLGWWFALKLAAAK